MLDFFDFLDQAGLYKEADELQKYVFSANNFITTKKKQTPQQQINTKLDSLSLQFNNLQDALENYDDGGDVKVELDGKEVQFKEHDI